MASKREMLSTRPEVSTEETNSLSWSVKKLKRESNWELIEVSSLTFTVRVSGNSDLPPWIQNYSPAEIALTRTFKDTITHGRILSPIYMGND